MTKEETTSFVKVLAGMYTITPTKEAVLYWHKRLQEIPRELVEAGFDTYQDTASNNNCPIPGQIRREALAKAAPFLKLSFLDAKQQKHPLYLVAVKREGSIKEYNPRGNASPTPEQMVWIEKAQEQEFLKLRDSYLERPLKELPACQTHFDAQLPATTQRARLELHRQSGTGWKNEADGVLEDLRRDHVDKKLKAGVIAKTRDFTEPHPDKPEPAPVTTKEVQGNDDQRFTCPDDYSHEKKKAVQILNS